MSSIYIHFPWCLAKCPYCDFVSYATDRESIDHRAYADAVVREAEGRARANEGLRDLRERVPRESRGLRDLRERVPRESRGLEVGSIFFGGGTPSLWEPAELGRVLARLRELFPTPAGTELEITVECNPTSLDAERAAALRDAGVNRLSIGTQSLRAEQLKYLGRLHDPDGARRAIEAALASGIERVSTDLIFGLPGQSVEDACSQADTLASTGLRHLSCYQLTIEPGTQFGERKKRGLLPMADDGVVADAFLAIEKTLEARGLRHYEISNYAAPGHEARHNLAYWHGDEYVGLGCAAYGRIGGVRYRNELDPKKYVAKADAPTIFTEDLDALALLRERIMLGLRLDGGMDLGRAGRELGIDPWTKDRVKAIDDQVSRGRLVRRGDVIELPRAAWLFTDDVASRLF